MWTAATTAAFIRYYRRDESSSIKNNLQYRGGERPSMATPPSDRLAG